MIVDETELSFQLVRESFERIFKQLDEGVGHVSYEINLDIQPFTRRSLTGEISNKTIDYKKLLVAASKASRGKQFHDRDSLISLLLNQLVVILLVASGHRVREILLEAYDLGMNNGEYTFLAIELIKSRRAGEGTVVSMIEQQY